MTGLNLHMKFSAWQFDGGCRSAKSDFSGGGYGYLSGLWGAAKNGNLAESEHGRTCFDPTKDLSIMELCDSTPKAPIAGTIVPQAIAKV